MLKRLKSGQKCQDTIYCCTRLCLYGAIMQNYEGEGEGINSIKEMQSFFIFGSGLEETMIQKWIYYY